MLLSEEHRIKACSSRSLFRQIDSYCYCAKNLSNSVNYMIRQIFRIHTKLKEGKVPRVESLLQGKSCVCKGRVVLYGPSVSSRISGSLKGTGMAGDHQPELPDR